MKIIGHQKIINLLGKAIAKKAVNHAYLFCGPEAVGKFTVALDFAEKLAGEGGKMNGNIIVVSPEISLASARGGASSTRGGDKKGIIKKKDIKIEQIRDLQHQLSLSSQDEKYKVAIIDEADRLNRTAQNALLKTLEEAGEKVVLILVSQDEKKMLPTILSRCQKIKFGTVVDTELAENFTNIGNKDEILFWSLGRPGLMFALSKNDEELVSRRSALTELKNLLAQNVADKFLLAENMAKDTNEAIKKINLWNVILREVLLGRQMGIKADSAKALKIIDNIEKNLNLLKETNSNTRLVLENLFLEF